MNKIIKSIKNFKLSPSALLFVLLTTISILGFQASKKYVQASRLSADLVVSSNATINGGVTADALYIGGEDIDFKLNVASGANISGVASYSPVPTMYPDDRNAVTVGYVNQRIADYLANR